MTQTLAALLGSIATAIAIFGGGLAVEAYKGRRERVGMALALAGAFDAMLGLIEAREMTKELREALGELDAGRAVEFGSLIRDNAPFRAITLSYANQIGGLGGDLPFRVARFLTYNQGLLHDLGRLDANRDKPEVQADADSADAAAVGENLRAGNRADCRPPEGRRDLKAEFRLA